MDPNLTSFLKEFARGQGRLTVLTGAGISAESGIPTFRGPEGYWTVGAKEYQPQEMATYRMFSKDPWEVWRWYLYRLGIVHRQPPTPGTQPLSPWSSCFRTGSRSLPRMWMAYTSEPAPARSELTRFMAISFSGDAISPARTRSFPCRPEFAGSSVMSS